MCEEAWAAGFFDGEGCVSVRRGRNRRYGNYLRLTITQADRRPLDRFQRTFDLGKVYGPRKPGPLGKKPLYYYVLQRLSDVNLVLDLLWPHLSEPKREQIVAVRERGLSYART